MVVLLLLYLVLACAGLAVLILVGVVLSRDVLRVFRWAHEATSPKSYAWAGLSLKPSTWACVSVVAVVAAMLLLSMTYLVTLGVIGFFLTPN